MKKNLSILLAVFLCISCRKDQAIPAHAPAETKIDGLELTFIKTQIPANPRGILFLDEATGFIVDYNGGIHKTSDGGKTWIGQTPAGDIPLFDIYFLNNNVGFAVGGRDNCGGTGCVPPGAVMLRTTDGGQTWKNVSLPLSQKIELQSIHFTDNLTGFAVGTGVVLSTKDGGDTWQDTSPPNAGAVFMDVKFKDKQNGLIAATSGKLLKTSDGGSNWNVTQPFEVGGVNTLAKVNDNVVIASAGCGLYKSADFGATWNKITAFPGSTSALLFTSENEGFAFGMGNYSGGDFGHNYGAIHYTKDGGQTWKGSTHVLETGVITAGCLVNSRLAYGVSGNVLVRVRVL
jgi:photosystem II stability/assembly factor-like uncharacterized protein